LRRVPTINIWIVTVPVIVVAIIFTLVWRMKRTLQERRAGFPSADERTQRIQGRAATYAFNAGSYFMILLNFYIIIGTEFTGWPASEAMFVLNASLLLMSLTYLAMYWHFSRNGDL